MSDLRAAILAEVEVREALLAKGTPLPWRTTGPADTTDLAAFVAKAVDISDRAERAFLAHCRDVYARHKDATHAPLDGCHGGGCCIGCGRFDETPLHRSAVVDCPELLSIARALGVTE